MAESPNPVRSLFTAGVIAGAAVGLVDGVWAALTARTDGAGLFACVAMTVGLHAVVGALLGTAAGALLAIGRWGRATDLPRWARGVSWLVAGAIAGVASGAAVVGTSTRNNRFLAAGVVCLATLAASVGAAIVGPAIGRLLARRGAPVARRAPSLFGLLVLAPLAALALGALLFVPVWYARTPLRGARLQQLIVIAVAASALLPALLARASAAGRSISATRAVAAALLLLGAPAIGVVATRWTQDFQYVRWSDAVVLVAIAAAGVALARRLVLRLWMALVATAAAVLLLFAGGASEPARKAAAAHAGLVSPFLDGARVALDFDHDGYTWLLGGGDCNDFDPTINPGAQEWPDDGIDQNCDGKDATAAGLRAPPLHPVPDSVPRDLNLVLVTIDTLRADHLGCYGYQRPTSPEIDKLAAESTLFENGWAHAPSTRYSMPAIATGRWPSAIVWEDCVGCENWWPRISHEHRTIGEALHALGYYTGALYAFQYFGRANQRGFERGIDHYEDRRAALHRNVNGPMESVGTSSREMADDAIAFVEGAKDKKFFLWLHFYDPHLGYERHPGAPSFGDAPGDLYDGEIWFTDLHLGRVLARLKELGLWDKTAIVVTGDHGEGLGEHGINAHGYHLYPPQTKVPFIVRVPGAQPRHVTTPVGHVDIAPTLVNLARGPQEPSFLGRSMLDLIMQSPSAAPPKPVFQEVTYECATGMDCTRRRALVTDQYQLIWNWMPDNTTECYDVRADPRELRDLWGTKAGGACPPLKAAVQDMVQALSFPPNFAEKMSFGVSAPGEPAPAPGHVVDARFGDAVHFEGYDLASPVVARGTQLEIVYHFEVLKRVPDGWRPFFHLEGPSGYRNLDHVPVEGAFPVERWRPGQHLRDRQRIAMPTQMPPGTYTLSMGFFRRNERLPVTPAAASDGTNRLRVTTIQVQ